MANRSRDTADESGDPQAAEMNAASIQRCNTGVSGDAAGGPVTVVEASESWDGTVLPPYPAGTPRVTILRMVIAPSERLAMHRHPVINAGVVLQGELTVVAQDGLSKTFRAGDGIVELVNTFHYGENRGAEPVELVMFYAGTAGRPLSERP